MKPSAKHWYANPKKNAAKMGRESRAVMIEVCLGWLHKLVIPMNIVIKACATNSNALPTNKNVSTHCAIGIVKPMARGGPFITAMLVRCAATGFVWRKRVRPTSLNAKMP